MNTFVYRDNSEKQKENLNVNKLTCKAATTFGKSLQISDETVLKETVKKQHELERFTTSEVCIYKSEFASGCVDDQFPECSPMNFASDDESTTSLEDTWDFDDEESAGSSTSSSIGDALRQSSYNVEECEKHLKTWCEVLKQYENELQDIIKVKLISYKRLNSSQENLQDVKPNEKFTVSNSSSLDQESEININEMALNSESNVSAEQVIAQILNELLELIEERDDESIINAKMKCNKSSEIDSDRFP